MEMCCYVIVSLVLLVCAHYFLGYNYFECFACPLQNTVIEFLMDEYGSRGGRR